MKPSDTNHLSEDQIIVALVDETDLPEDCRTHLNDCPHCRQILAAAKEPLERMGALAGDHSPGPMRPVRIDGQRPAKSGSLSWRSGLAWATAAAVLLALTWAGPWVREWRRPENVSATATVDPEARFMAEVARLVDDPLPDRYRRLIGGGEAFEDDFMDFIVPPVNERGPTTRQQPEKGGRPC